MSRHRFLTLSAVVAAALIGTAQAHSHEDSDALSDTVRATTLSVNFDKPAQRRVGVRTQAITAGPPAFSLPAQVVADPRRQVLLTANQAGRIEAPAGGFPNAGSRVHAGQILALLWPTMSTPEQRDLQSDLVYARRDAALGKTQIKRYGINMAEKFDVKLPTPSLQVVLDYRTAEARAKAYGDALSQTIPLIAPTDGTLLHILVRRGASVATGQALFELVARNPCAIELRFTDEQIDAAAAVQATTAAGITLTLNFLGETYDPDARLHRAFYEIPAQDAALAIGEPVNMQVPGAQPERDHWRVPETAVVKDRSTSWIWLHEAAERFVAHAVKVESASAGWVQVEGPFDEDDRVVIEGAGVLQQRARAENPA